MTECFNCSKELDQYDFAGEFWFQFHKQYDWTEDTDKQPICEECLKYLKSKGLEQVVDEVFSDFSQKSEVDN